MNFIKRLIPNKLKQEGKYFLQNLLKIPYTRSGVPLEILNLIPKNRAITFFDIGANVGHFSTSMAAEYRIKKAILAEPVSRLIPILEEKFSDKSVFKILNVAISDSAGEVDFYLDEDAHFISSLLRIDNKGEELVYMNFRDPVLTKVLTLTLDQIMIQQQLEAIDLLKIDVQGAEHLVLQGGIEALKRTKVIYTEFSFKPVYKGSSVFFDLYKFLYDHDFILTNISPGFTSKSGELLQGDATFVNKKIL